jgi:hypothetical protein
VLPHPIFLRRKTAEQRLVTIREALLGEELFAELEKDVPA